MREAFRYLVIGAGGTGGCIGGFLAAAGSDVTLIARGAHLQAMRENGLTILRVGREPMKICPVQAMTEEEYERRGSVPPDVVFVCVKGYGVEGILPFLRRVCGPETVVIPILNVYGTGGRMAEQLRGISVMDGCIYIASEISAPGQLTMSGDIFRVVFGPRDPEAEAGAFPKLEQVAEDLRAAGITPLVSREIRRDAFEKFSFVSAQAAAGAYYNVAAEAFQREGKERETMIALFRECEALAEAMGIPFLIDVTEKNLGILDGIAPSMTTSMQRDLKKGGPSELDGLVFEPVRMGARLGVWVPTYEKIAEALRDREGR